MKTKLFNIFISIIIVSLLSENVMAFSLFKKQEVQTTEPQKLEEVELDLNENNKLKIEKNEPVKTLEESNLSPKDEAMIRAFQNQKKQDLEDITNLWKATIERNNVIKFAIKKVSMNPEERKKHSSKMARSISALINGATLLPYMFGLDASIASAVAAGASLSAQAARNKLGYGQQNIPITDTELIQLASLIEDLQNDLIRNYYAYKSSIDLLKDCRSKVAVYQKNYKEALSQKDEANILVTKALLDKQQLEALKLKNKIKSARLELERFAGEEVVNNLNLVNAKDTQASALVEGDNK